VVRYCSRVTGRKLGAYSFGPFTEVFNVRRSTGALRLPARHNHASPGAGDTLNRGNGNFPARLEPSPWYSPDVAARDFHSQGGTIIKRCTGIDLNAADSFLLNRFHRNKFPVYVGFWAQITWMQQATLAHTDAACWTSYAKELRWRHFVHPHGARIRQDLTENCPHWHRERPLVILPVVRESRSGLISTALLPPCKYSGRPTPTVEPTSPDTWKDWPEVASIPSRFTRTRIPNISR